MKGAQIVRLLHYDAPTATVFTPLLYSPMLLHDLRSDTTTHSFKCKQTRPTFRCACVHSTNSPCTRPFSTAVAVAFRLRQLHNRANVRAGNITRWGARLRGPDNLNPGVKPWHNGGGCFRVQISVPPDGLSPRSPRSRAETRISKWMSPRETSRTVIEQS